MKYDSFLFSFTTLFLSCAVWNGIVRKKSTFLNFAKCSKGKPKKYVERHVMHVLLERVLDFDEGYPNVRKIY